MGCFSGRLMSAASDQKLFCKLSSPFCCSFNEFVEEKVITRPIPPPSWLLPKPIYFENNVLDFQSSRVSLHTLMLSATSHLPFQISIPSLQHIFNIYPSFVWLLPHFYIPIFQKTFTTSLVFRFCDLYIVIDFSLKWNMKMHTGPSCFLSQENIISLEVRGRIFSSGPLLSFPM